jgi:phage replication initiation protein
MGYRSCLFRGDVRVYHQGMIGMGVHVVISGQGCRQLEEEGVIDFEPGALFGWRGMLESLLGLGANVARLDVAMDDREGLLRLDVIRQSVRAGACVSRFKAGTMYEKCSLVDGCGQGETAYFGSKKSNMFIRIYDKAKEQLLPAGVHWVRVEAQARNENAQQLAQLIVDKGLGVLAPVLNGYVRFVEPSETDSTRSRWAVCDWWSAFLGVVERMPLGVAPVCRTLGEVADNLRRQYAPAIAMVMNSPIMGTRWLRETVSDGMARWRPKHFDMMAAAVEHLKPCFADSAAAPKHRAVPPYLLGLSLGETLRDRRIKAAWSGE